SPENLVLVPRTDFLPSPAEMSVERSSTLLLRMSGEGRKEPVGRDERVEIRLVLKIVTIF
ncbi:MAG: hypothetical protein LUB59_06990, partial [Candidatus Gastranaerophilales bacterium]|nr:hypothetical protein [Candidatus Gastranaerophilales bacterium]